jgi:uncharacterized cofD-like protein
VPDGAASDRETGIPARSERDHRVVALGGGHGLAVALQAIRRYAGTTTAVVSVADDGGSSGRLRRDLGVAAPGDLRKCLVALASGDGPWPAAFEHRFDSGELAGHALGNLMLVGLADSLGDLTAALDELGRLLGAVGRVLPATIDPVSVKAYVGGRPVVGQVLVESTAATGTVQRVELVPADPPATPGALAAIAAADQIVIAPGSLYTSVLAAVCVPEICAAIERAPGRVVQVCNLQPDAETAGLDGTEHLRVLIDHGVRVDAVLHDPAAALAVSETAVRSLGVAPVAASVATGDGTGHDPAKLAQALAALL